MSIVNLFWTCVFSFGIIGAMRGWAKELMVIFSVVTALAFNLLLEKYIPLVRDLDKASSSVFWIRILILIAMVYFGYQTVNISRFAAKAARERLQDSLFGAVLGGVNGYLVAGTVLYYNHVANYPYRNIIIPATDLAIIDAINRMMAYMPPRFLGEPGIYFAVIIILIFIIVVYI
ncbi:MAG TPA: CvpA family protein [Anaerolineales bacterium]|nr:CvpA family protein [Anaerolineales bacterium]